MNVTDTNQQPQIKTRKSTDMYISPIWVLPILALFITIWIIVRVTVESKIPITLEMASAEGISVGKTQIKFRGINSGKVTKVEVTEDLSKVIVHAEVIPNIAPFLTTKTQFWVVRPQISLAGVSGLDAVLGGDYIAFEPNDQGEPSRRFVALKSAPAIKSDEPGLHLTLEADKLGSVSEGSQLFYRQIPIGEVKYFRLTEDSKAVRITVLIENQYAHLVNSSTVFWNSGGIRLKGSLSGFEIQSESLAAVLAGGISLFTPYQNAETVEKSRTFELHDDYDSAGVGVPVKIHFSSGYDLKSGITEVKMQGLKVGHLNNISVAIGSNSGITATVIIDPGAESFLNQDTKFWLVKPSLSISNFSNLGTLISGNYINMKVGESDSISREFIALDGPPPPDFSEPGLHLYLRSDDIGSLNVGTPILFKGIEVGAVTDILIDNLSEGVGFHLLIKPKFALLINASTRFWNVSGINISAGLGGVKVRAESIMTMINGGIAFTTPKPAAEAVDNGFEFHLLDSQDGSENKITFIITMPSAGSLEPGFTKLKYKGFEAGLLRKVSYDNINDEVIAELSIDSRFKDILKQNSLFWLVKPKIKASEVIGLDALLSGVYFEVRPGDGEQQKKFKLSASAPSADWSTAGLHLILNAKSAGGLQAGSAVYFQDIAVGSVESVQLNDLASAVEIQIHIKPEFENRVKSHSQFFNTSGVSVTASVKGLTVDVSSIDSILSGGIAFVTDNSIQDSLTVKNGETFSLYESQEAALEEGFIVVLDLQDGEVVNEGAAITYKGIKIGEVIKTQLNPSNKSVELTVTIRNDMRALVNSNSKFWLAKTEFGLLRQKNLSNLLTGPDIRLIPGVGKSANHFTVLSYSPVIKSRETGLNIVLESAVLGSISIGAPVNYRQITVGEVLGFELSKNAHSVEIYINIDLRYQSLVRDNSQFWNSSGLAFEASLFSGIEVKSESLETMVAGGVSFATPENVGSTVNEQFRFKLAKEFEKKWQEWQPTIPLF